jgi:hypothetical protein
MLLERDVIHTKGNKSLKRIDLNNEKSALRQRITKRAHCANDNLIAIQNISTLRVPQNHLVVFFARWCALQAALRALAKEKAQCHELGMQARFPIAR